jgi:hypothetical protein
MTSHFVDQYLEYEPCEPAPEPSPRLTDEMADAFDTPEEWWAALEAEALAELRNEVNAA